MTYVAADEVEFKHLISLSPFGEIQLSLKGKPFIPFHLSDS